MGLKSCLAPGALLGMTPMYVHVVQTLVSEGMYKHWCQPAQLALAYGVAEMAMQARWAFAFGDQLALPASSSVGTTPATTSGRSPIATQPLTADISNKAESGVMGRSRLSTVPGCMSHPHLHRLKPMFLDFISTTEGLGTSTSRDDQLECFSSFASKPSLPAKASAFRHRLLVQQGRI